MSREMRWFIFYLLILITKTAGAEPLKKGRVLCESMDCNSHDVPTGSVIEFAEDFSGKWNAVPAYPVPMKLQAGSTKFSHTTEAEKCFYRVRIAEQSGR